MFKEKNENQLLSKKLATDSLLAVSDVAAIMGLTRQTASKLITDTGRAVVLHRRKYILASDLEDWIRDFAHCGCEGA